jgi:hypothetical protein
MDGGNLPTPNRFTNAELEAIVLELADRVLWLESRFCVPMSYVDKISAEKTARKRWENARPQPAPK